MKNKLIIALMAITVLGAGINAKAQISGTAHDFSALGWNTSGEMCLPCHTPHAAQAGNGPLWNHATNTTVFTLYSSGSLQATVGQPGPESMACLSCHDGTVALDSFGGSTTGTTFIATSHKVGGSSSLANEHPVGFTYDAALVTSDGGGLKAPPANLLFSGKMECASCHDVHNEDGFDGLLRVDNAASALCLTCHDK